MVDRRLEDDPDAPPTAEEVTASAKLRDEGDPLFDALKAAWSPDPLDEGAHAALLDETVALDADELALATALRDALGEDPVATALAAAWRPTELSDAEHEVLLARALSVLPAADKSNVVAFRLRRAALATTTVLAFAASVVVWMGNVRTELPLGKLAQPRSTQALFDEPFHPGEASARIDRIAVARASDLRDNQFAKWGAK